VHHINPSDQDIAEWLPATLPDRRIKYGTDPLQFGDLRLPAGPAPAGGHPVAIVLHGGGYSPNWNLDNVARLAESLTTVGGVATWNLEYRRPGQVGGGWPGTWLDIANGIDHLRAIAPAFSLDLDRVVAVGHSAGGTFATWAAARGGVPESSDLYVADPVKLAGVVCLSGMLDLDSEIDDRANPPRHLKGLVTDDRSEPDGGFEAHLSEITPVGLAHRIHAPQRLIIGSLDGDVMIQQTRDFAAALRRDGGAAGTEITDVTEDYLDGANHFDVIDPRGAAWPVVAGAAFGLLGVDVPADRLGARRYSDAG
jgi:acetyl esterase/lipase